MKSNTLNFGWLLLIPILVSAWNYSCNSAPKNPKELAAADSLRADLRIADSLLKTLEKEKVKQAEDAVRGNSAFIEDGINKLQDTLDLETATFLTEYRSIAKILGIYVSNHDRLKGAIDSLKTSCDNLSHDLRNNSLAEGLDPVKSVNNERVQVHKLMNELNFLIPAVGNGLKTNDSLSPKIKAYIEELNAKLAARNNPGPAK
ncbi:MAG: hypothetical protein FD123_2018 [Bacteroidetes bacterium]|nr:MAG: hypothetical protein FD123_2018 [Bacteroidota bacterium]